MMLITFCSEGSNRGGIMDLHNPKIYFFMILLVLNLLKRPCNDGDLNWFKEFINKNIISSPEFKTRFLELFEMYYYSLTEQKGPQKKQKNKFPQYQNQFPQYQNQFQQLQQKFQEIRSQKHGSLKKTNNQ